MSEPSALPLVLVHGYMGGKAQWDLQSTEGDLQSSLAQEHELIIIELPGFGAHSHLPSSDSIAGFADYALDELSARGIERFHLLGHSMGGMIVQEMMAKAPQKIAKFILYGTAATGNLPNRFESFETSKQRIYDDGVAATARRISATWFLDYEAAAEYQNCANVALQSSKEAMISSLEAMRQWDRQDNLSSITAPTLIIWGEADRTYHWQQIEQLWSLIPDAHLAVMPYCAHAAHMENPRLFNQIVGDFLAQP